MLPSDALLAALATLPEAVQAQLPAALGLASLEPAGLGFVHAHHLELSDALASVYVLTVGALVRLQVAPTGALQRTVVPLHHLARVDELYDGTALTVILELDADQRSLALAGASLEGRLELTGTELPNGWVLQGDPGSLTRFATAVRARLVDPR